MRRTAIIALILSLSLSSCATTYKDADGNTEIADSVCSSGVCPLLIIGMLAGIGVAVAHAR